MRASSPFKNVSFYKISSEIDMYCRPGALTGRLFQQAARQRVSSRLSRKSLSIASLRCKVAELEQS